MRIAGLILPVVIAVLATSSALAAKVTLSGEVTYRERIALPDDATLEIQLVDQSLPTAPPRLDVRAPIGAGQVPLSFNLGFDDALIIPSHTYALIAAIGVDSGLMFRNFEPYVVNPLAPVGPITIVTNLVGQIDTGAPSSELETPASPAILDTSWTAEKIGEASVLPNTTVSLTIASDMRAGGSGGCNSWFAQAEVSGESVRFGAIGSTKKSCGETIDAQEQAFNAALAATTSWRVEGEILTLYGTNGTVVFHR
jgi:putative lipoprotein